MYNFTESDAKVLARLELAEKNGLIKRVFENNPWLLVHYKGTGTVIKARFNIKIYLNSKIKKGESVPLKACCSSPAVLNSLVSGDLMTIFKSHGRLL